MKFSKPHRFTPYIPNMTEQGLFNQINSLGISLETKHWKSAIPAIRGSGVVISRFKDNLKTHLLREQENCCAYCGFEIDDRIDFQRDHIADKAIHTEFLLEPANLVLSCPGCNGFKGKANYNTLSLKDPIYTRCVFNIVHPYFDNYNSHIEFNIALVVGKTDKGKKTIEVFKLDFPQMTARRKMHHQIEAREPLSIRLASLFDLLIQKLSRR